MPSTNTKSRFEIGDRLRIRERACTTEEAAQMLESFRMTYQTLGPEDRRQVKSFISELARSLPPLALGGLGGLINTSGDSARMPTSQTLVELEGKALPCESGLTLAKSRSAVLRNHFESLLGLSRE